MPSFDDYYEDFLYGLVFPPAEKWGSGSYFIRTDRVLFDWIIEPVPDEVFVDRIAYVDLPHGYFVGKGGLHLPGTPMSEGVKTKVHVYWKTRILTKALHAITQAEEIPEQEFRQLGIPEYRIFYIDTR